jgi:hypothetical protein
VKARSIKKSYRQTSAAPTTKVLAGSMVGTMVTIVVWVLNTSDLLPGGKDVPSEVATAITTLLTFMISYLVPPSARDAIS